MKSFVYFCFAFSREMISMSTGVGRLVDCVCFLSLRSTLQVSIAQPAALAEFCVEKNIRSPARRDSFWYNV